MQPQNRLCGVVLASLLPLAAVTAEAVAQEIDRSNWVPNVGRLAEGEQPLGDMWTFRCPSGGTVSVSVDTKDDTDTGESDIDPVLALIDGAGNSLAFADDEVACTYPPVCGYSCPSITTVACGEGGRERHSLVVRDYGTASATGTFCQEGGGYNLTVAVFEAGGRQLSEREVGLDGGPRRTVPKWALELGKAPVGPALDDEDVPHGQEFFASGANRSTFSPDALITK
jgi:hypothetical protein